MRIASDQSIMLRPEGDGSSAEIIIADKRTGTSVEGRVLEAALVCDPNYVLFVTTDTAFEETLSIYLVDRGGSVLDTAWIGAPYSTGAFTKLQIVGDDCARFRFIGETDWTLQVLAAPRFSVPYMGDAPGVRRPFGFHRRLVIHGDPKPQR